MADKTGFPQPPRAFGLNMSLILYKCVRYCKGTQTIVMFLRHGASLLPFLIFSALAISHGDSATEVRPNLLGYRRLGDPCGLNVTDTVVVDRSVGRSNLDSRTQDTNSRAWKVDEEIAATVQAEIQTSISPQPDSSYWNRAFHTETKLS